MSLIEIINNNLNTKFSDDQGSWRQFILDHLDYIAQRSNSYMIDADLMYGYRYDLQRYLKENQRIHQDIAWIVLLLNNMGSDLEFDTPGEYVIPNDTLIQNLYYSYMTVKGRKE